MAEWMKHNEWEEWLAWIVRASREAETVMDKFLVPDWVWEVHRRRYQWAGTVSRRTDARWPLLDAQPPPPPLRA